MWRDLWVALAFSHCSSLNLFHLLSPALGSVGATPGWVQCCQGRATSAFLGHGQGDLV